MRFPERLETERLVLRGVRIDDAPILSATIAESFESLQRTMTRCAFEQLGVVRVEIRMDERNARSAAVPARLGFRREGRLVNHRRDNRGELCNSLLFALTDLDDLRS